MGARLVALVSVGAVLGLASAHADDRGTRAAGPLAADTSTGVVDAPLGVRRGLPLSDIARQRESVWRALYIRPDAIGEGRLQPGGSQALSRGVTDMRAVGDVMLGRGVAELIRRHGPSLIPDDVVGLLHGDVTVGNLEGPLAESGRPRSGLPSLGSPPATSIVLARAGFDALSLANNHALDAGPRGLERTLSALHGVSIQPLGIATAEERAAISLLAFADRRLAGPSGAAHVLVLDEHALEAVRAASGQRQVVVLVHWGDEYQSRPSARQKEWAQRLATAGADLIVGSHPHVLQPVEVIEAGPRSTIVAYSLGNFIFDQTEREDTRTGAILRVQLDRRGVVGAWAAPTTMRGGRVRALAPGSGEHAGALERLRGP